MIALLALKTLVFYLWIATLTLVFISRSHVSSSGLVFSSNCESSIATLLQSIDLTECPNILSAFKYPQSFALCTYNRANVNCFNPYSIIGYVDMLKERSPIVSTYNLTDPNFPLGNTTPCSLCHKYPNPSKSSCHDILEVVRSIVLESVDNYFGKALDTLTILNVNNFIAASTLVLQSCSPSSSPRGPMDTIKIAFLSDQSKIMCSAGLSFGFEVSDKNMLVGALDMRATLQCGTCSMIPCLPGQICRNGDDAEMCPEGFYCPNTRTKIICPRGYYCGKGSIEPKKCRGISGGSCESEGSTREIVWVPLFFALLLYSIVVGCSHFDMFTPRWLLEARGISNIGHNKSSNYIISRSSSSSNNSNNNNYNYNYNNNSSSICSNISSNYSKLSSSSVSVEFQDLTMTTGVTKRLDNVSGKIEAKKFTAIFGGSGAGKTSLMSALLSREAITAGSIHFNCLEWKLPLSQIRHLVGFVPQLDVLLRSMTVHQALFHSARSRLSPTYSCEEVNEIINSVLCLLDLMDKKHAVIGGEENDDSENSHERLGPGDRKKVNIGLELVARPRVLFLDEPTTNIDASSAFKIVKILKNLSQSGVTVIAVIHQPRGEIFNYIDNMLLMVPGGRVGYNGPINLGISWFKSIGLRQPDVRSSKTDFFLDVTCSSDLGRFVGPGEESNSGQSDAVGTSNTTDSKEKSSSSSSSGSSSICSSGTCNFSGLWTTKGQSFLSSHSSQPQEARDNAGSGEILSPQKSLDLPVIETDILSHQKSSWVYLVYLHFYRGALQRIKSNNLTINLTVHLVAGFILGIVTSGGPLLTPPVPLTYVRSCPPGAEMVCFAWQRFGIGPATFLLSMVLGLIAIPSAVNTFGRERDVLYREAAVGVDSSSYFVGKLLSDIPFICLSAFMYACPILAVAPWNIPFDPFYVILLSLSLFVTSFGYFLSFIIPNSNDATLAGAIISIIFNLFGGFVPKIGEGIMGTLSYTHYVSRAIVASELTYGMGYTAEMYDTLVPIPWREPSISLDIGVVFIMTAILYVVAFVVFRRDVAKNTF